jgi:eukaryotic-like serine/threonine-protein kinase
MSDQGLGIVRSLSDAALDRLQAVASWPEFLSERYSIVEQIGRGGMGAVYLARDAELGREVAVKISSAAASSALEDRLRTEATILARLEHPGIVPIHDVGRLADGRLFYVMQRVRGETLAAHLKSAIELSARLRIFERICDSVAFAHAHGFIHRDLKPENVMVGAFGEVLVMDWGIAKVLRSGGEPTDNQSPSSSSVRADGRTRAGTILGTHGFMAPEQARGAADAVDVRADVYGLGALLFMMLTGVAPPSDADQAVARILRHRHVPKPLRAICAHAMAPAPGDRYADVPSLAADIARFRAGHAVGAHHETPFEQASRLAKTYRTPILLVLAYLVMRTIVAITTGR